MKWKTYELNLKKGNNMPEHKRFKNENEYFTKTQYTEEYIMYLKAKLG